MSTGIDLFDFPEIAPDRCAVCGGFTHETADCPRAEFCGDEQPHERHEYLRGVRRFECAGVENSHSVPK